MQIKTITQTSVYTPKKGKNSLNYKIPNVSKFAQQWEFLYTAIESLNYYNYFRKQLDITW